MIKSTLFSNFLNILTDFNIFLSYFDCLIDIVKKKSDFNQTKSKFGWFQSKKRSKSSSNGIWTEIRFRFCSQILSQTEITVQSESLMIWFLTPNCQSLLHCLWVGSKIRNCSNLEGSAQSAFFGKAKNWFDLIWFINSLLSIQCYNWIFNKIKKLLWQ